MALATWIAFGCALALVLASTVWAALRGLRTWRAVKAYTRRTGAALDTTTQAAAVAEARAAAVTAGTERLTDAISHLESSLAELEILRAAVAEARATLDPRQAIPRK
jgi:hypothetical protein